MNEQKHIEQLQASLVALLRARLNVLINALGLGAANASAQIFTLLVLLILGVNIFLFLNIALGLLIGEWIGSLGLGFLILTAVYLLCLAVYLIAKPRVEANIQDGVARKVHRFSDNINLTLNEKPQLLVSPAYREAFISGEPMPYHALSLRLDEARKQATHAGQDLQRGVQYLKHNYMAVFGSMAQRSVPSLRYISPLISLMSAKKKRKPQAIDPQRRPASVSFFERNVQAIKPYIPYISTAYQFLAPVVSAFVVGKTQGWLISKLLKRKKSTKK